MREDFRLIRCLLGACLLAAFVAGLSAAQEKPESPVFKRYRPPAEPPLIGQSDGLYQIWQTFLVTRKANAVDMLAQHELGIRYLIGRGAAPDTVKAAYWIKKAADQDYTPARFNYGILNYHGWGVPWDPFEAYRHFRICAEHHMPEAEYAMAQFLTENLIVPRDYESASRWLKVAADSGYAPAQEALARFEKQGLGKTAKDGVQTSLRAPNTGLVFLEFTSDTTSAGGDSLLLREAIRSAGPALRKALGMTSMLEQEPETDAATLEVIRRAGDAGSPEALTVLGRSYEKGTGVSRDPVRAVAFYVRAIRFDSPRAPELLWNLLQEKETLPQVKSAAGRGEPEGQFAWAGISALGFDGVLARAQIYVTGEQAFQLLRKAGDGGFLPALVETGLCYYAGRWVPQSNEKAMEVWKKAAERGSSDAKVRIALTSLRSGADTTGWAGDVVLLMSAAEEGSVLAQVGLGYCYETGTVVQAQKADAALYYRAASVRGSQDAFRALRRMHDTIRPNEPQYGIAD